MNIKSIIKKILGDKLTQLIIKARMPKEKILIPVDDEIEVKARKEFYSNFVQSGDLCFDVGANTGNRISPLLQLNAKIIAVEPQEECQKILKAKFGKKITLVKFGLGEKEEVKDFYISDASTISSFSKEWIDSVKEDRFKEHNWNTVTKIQMTTLDNLISKYGKPKFIKIDVEGFELEVLKGLTQCVNYISYEYTTPEQTHKAIECIKYIDSICPGIECNYSVGESMQLELRDWKNKFDMIEIINSNEFINTGFGDIYIKKENI